jgi:hypothetical protein
MRTLPNRYLKNGRRASARMIVAGNVPGLATVNADP